MFWKLIAVVVTFLQHSANPERIANLVETAISKEGQFGALAPGANLELARTEINEFGNAYDLSIVVTRKSGVTGEIVSAEPFVPAPVAPVAPQQPPATPPAA